MPSIVEHFLRVLVPSWLVLLYALPVQPLVYLIGSSKMIFYELLQLCAAYVKMPNSESAVADECRFEIVRQPTNSSTTTAQQQNDSDRNFMHFEIEELHGQQIVRKSVAVPTKTNANNGRPRRPSPVQLVPAQGVAMSDTAVECQMFGNLTGKPNAQEGLHLRPRHAEGSWLYVLLYALPVQPLVYLIGSSKLALFFAIRFLIGALCLFAELSLYESVCRRAGNSVGRAFLLFSLLSPAMFGASCAFLPSSFSMALNALAMALWLREQWFLSILTASSALVGWPFAALLGLPIVLQMLLLRSQLALKFVLYSSILVPFCWHHFVPSTPISLANLSLFRSTLCCTTFFLPMAQLSTVLSRPPPERFLFPVYPHICVLAAVGIDMLRRLLLLLLGVVFVPRSSPFYRFVVYGTTVFCLGH
uniref:Mannosyltransferase n=1 Tax=Globodera rostochiensis TaxID=31243 RepID=A0A914HFI9_GLORO